MLTIFLSISVDNLSPVFDFHKLLLMIASSGTGVSNVFAFLVDVPTMYGYSGIERDSSSKVKKYA